MAKMILPQGTKAPDAELIDGIDSSKLTQEAFSTIKAGGTDINADTTKDTLELSGDANISIVPDATTDKITIGIADEAAQRWDSKQEALGYTPINKAGDKMTGELQAPSINLGGRFKFVYDPNTDSLVLEVSDNG